MAQFGKDSFRRATAKLGAKLQAAQYDVHVGVPDTTHKSGIQMTELAAIHEYGTDTIPERAPFRKTIAANRNKYKDGLGLAARIAMTQGTRGYEVLGAKAASDVQRMIASGLEPENAPSTVARKGSSKPLIDTGEFRQSITYQVVKTNA